MTDPTLLTLRQCQVLVAAGSEARTIDDLAERCSFVHEYTMEVAVELRDRGFLNVRDSVDGTVAALTDAGILATHSIYGAATRLIAALKGSP